MGPRDLMILVSETLVALGVRHFVSGSMAAMLYGEFRATLDIDIVVLLDQPDAPLLASAFPPDQWYVPPIQSILDAITRVGHFSLIHQASGLKVDFMLPRHGPFTEARFSRARRIEVAPGRAVPFASAEDVIIMKLVHYEQGGSEKHLRDIASIVRISAPHLDQAYIRRWADTLGVLATWTALNARLDSTDD